MNKITPFLWYNGNLEEVAKFYTSVFKDAKVLSGNMVQSVTMEVEGQQFIVFNGGPHYTLTPAFSFFVNCETQEEVDELWDKFIAGGGKESRCGWLVDKFGISWQIIPTILGRLLSDPDREKANRAMQAMLKMNKINIKALQDAYDQK